MAIRRSQHQLLICGIVEQLRELGCTIVASNVPAGRRAAAALEDAARGTCYRFIEGSHAAVLAGCAQAMLEKFRNVRLGPVRKGRHLCEQMQRSQRGCQMVA